MTKAVLAAVFTMALARTAGAGPFDGEPHEFPPLTETRRVKLVGQFSTVIPAWHWQFLLNPRHKASSFRMTWMRTYTMQGSTGDLKYTQKTPNGRRSPDQRGTYTYSARKMTGPAAEDDGSEVRLFPINPETGLVVQGVGVVRSVVDRKYDYRREWSAHMQVAHLASTEQKCPEWLESWRPGIVSDEKKLHEQYREGPIRPTTMGGMPAWSRRVTHDVFSVRFGVQHRIPNTSDVACLDTDRGRYLITFRSTSNVHDALFHFMQQAMDEFKLEKEDRRAERACPSDLFKVNRGDIMNPYSCVNACPPGTRASPPGDFPYKDARACVK